MEHIVILLELRVIMVVQRLISYVNVFGPYWLLREICVFTRNEGLQTERLEDRESSSCSINKAKKTKKYT